MLKPSVNQSIKMDIYSPPVQIMFPNIKDQPNTYLPKCGHISYATNADTQLQTYNNINAQRILNGYREF